MRTREQAAMSENAGLRPSEYSIKDVCRLTGLTARAVRVYENYRLVSPRRGAHGVRRFGPRAIDRLNFIALARRLGLPLATIRQLLELQEAQGPAAAGAAFVRCCYDQIDALREQLVLLEQVTNQAGGGRAVTQLERFAASFN
jgi:MerR family copper efflux transcriptional regulator